MKRIEHARGKKFDEGTKYKPFFVVVSLLLVASASPALAKPKEITPSTVMCQCLCAGGGAEQTKSWSWGGSRSGCQSYNNAECRMTVGNQTAYGRLSNCDVEVFRTVPGGTKFRPPETLAPSKLR